MQFFAFLLRFSLKVIRKDELKKNSTEDKRVCRNAIFRFFIKRDVRNDAGSDAGSNAGINAGSDAGIDAGIIFRNYIPELYAEIIFAKRMPQLYGRSNVEIVCRT